MIQSEIAHAVLVLKTNIYIKKLFAYHMSIALRTLAELIRIHKIKIIEVS